MEKKKYRVTVFRNLMVDVEVEAEDRYEAIELAECDALGVDYRDYTLHDSRAVIRD